MFPGYGNPAPGWPHPQRPHGPWGVTPVKIAMALSVLFGGGGGTLTLYQLGALPGQVEELLANVGGLDEKVDELDREVERVHIQMKALEELPDESEITLMISGQLSKIEEAIQLLRDRVVVLETASE